MINYVQNTTHMEIMINERVDNTVKGAITSIPGFYKTKFNIHKLLTWYTKK